MKFLGVCILLSSALLSASIAFFAMQLPRYQPWEPESSARKTYGVFDGSTGIFLLREHKDHDE